MWGDHAPGCIVLEEGEVLVDAELTKRHRLATEPRELGWQDPLGLVVVGGGVVDVLLGAVTAVGPAVTRPWEAQVGDAPDCVAEVAGGDGAEAHLLRVRQVERREVLLRVHEALATLAHEGLGPLIHVEARSRDQ